MVHIIALSHKITIENSEEKPSINPPKNTHNPTQSSKLQSLFPITPPRPHKRAPKGSHKDPPPLPKKTQKKQNTHEIVKQMGQLSSSMKSPREGPIRVLERDPQESFVLSQFFLLITNSCVVGFWIVREEVLHQLLDFGL
jgi:hypothetical protein